VVGVVALVVMAGVVSLAIFHANEGRGVPGFASLAENPDPSLQGTVAYYDSHTACVRLVAAAGQPSRELYCLPHESTAEWVKFGKPAGPQLVWRADGRLEITMFRMVPLNSKQKTAPVLQPGWQKIVDPHTGAVENVAAADVPSAPRPNTGPTVSPNGQRIAWRASAQTGKVRVQLTDTNGTRTLLSVHGPGEYGYQFGPVFWAPNWQWIAATDDGRILVITPNDPSVTRVLVTDSGGGAGGGSAGPEFAVTTENLFGSLR
jgi:hypothetical protein